MRKTKQKQKPKEGSQADIILTHLKRRDITHIEAAGLYGIGQVASVVHRLKLKGWPITKTFQHGIRAQYAVYSLSRRGA